VNEDVVGLPNGDFIVMNKFRTELEMNDEGGYMIERAGATVTVNGLYTREFINEAEATQFMYDVTKAGVFDRNGWHTLEGGEQPPLEMVADEPGDEPGDEED